MSGSRGIAWLLPLAVTAAVSAALALAHLPTPLLFGGLVGGVVHAIARPARPLTVPRSWFVGGQAVVGALVGVAVDWSALGSLGAAWVVVLLVSTFSLVVSVAAGLLLVRRGLSPVTATLSTIAGGAAGLSAVAGELGADGRVVATLQYLRLLVVLVTMPLVATLAYGATADASPVAVAAHALGTDLAFAALAVGVGLLGGRLLRLPTAVILGPALAASLLTLVPVFDGAQVPAVVAALGYAVIGLRVGLGFTLGSLRLIGRLLPTALLTIAITLAACAALGWVLVATTSVSPLDAYLATNPGGIYAVLGMSAATGGDVTFVTATQVLRLLVVLGCAPLLASYLSRADDR